MSSKNIPGDVGGDVTKSSLFTLTSDALCIAVKTALRLVDQTSTNTDCHETANETLAFTVTTALRLVEQSDSESEDNIKSLPEISLDQVSWHDNADDCWIVLYDHVYDITQFLWEHPGGEEILLEYAGRDASLAFRGVGHTTAALQALESYLVGILPERERLFKQKTGPLSLTQSTITWSTVNG